MLFAALVRALPDGRASADDAERQAFLESLLRSGQLLLEGTFGDSGSLMLLEAESTNDALALLQNDPYVLSSSRIQIRPLVVNFLGSLAAATVSVGAQARGDVSRQQSGGGG